jgi:hypothetical protein
LASEAKGRGFDPRQPHQIFLPSSLWNYFRLLEVQGLLTSLIGDLGSRAWIRALLVPYGVRAECLR